MSEEIRKKERGLGIKLKARCPVCDSDELKILVSIPRDRKLAYCKKCSIVIVVDGRTTFIMEEKSK